MIININGKPVEVSNKDLQAAIEGKQESINVNSEDFILRTLEEENSFKENTRKEGITIGSEIGRKNVLKGLGIEVDGAHKNDDTAIDALKSWTNNQVSTALTDAKVEPNKKLQQYESDINTLKGTIQTLQSEKDNVLNEFTGYKKNQLITNTLSGLIPDNVVIDKSDMLTLLSTKIKTEVDENNNIVAIGSDGQVIKNKTTLEPLSIKSVVSDFFDNNPHYLKGVEGGTGGGDSHGGDKKQTMDAFMSEMKEKGVTMNSEPFVKEMLERQKAGLLEL